MYIGQVFLCVQMGTYLITTSLLWRNFTWKVSSMAIDFAILLIGWSFVIDQGMVISTFVPVGKFCKMLGMWNELPYPLLYLREVCIFLWYFDRN